MYIDGHVKEFPPASMPRSVYFGSRIKFKRPLLYNLPEVATIHKTLNVPRSERASGKVDEYIKTNGYMDGCLRACVPAA